MRSRREPAADLILAVVVALLFFIILTVIDGELLDDSMPWGVELAICFGFVGAGWFMQSRREC